MKRFLLSLVVIGVLSALTFAVPATPPKDVCWNPVATDEYGNPVNDVAGYKVYTGTVSGDYIHYSVMDVKTLTPNSSDGKICQKVQDGSLRGIYHFVVSAYDTSGNEGLLSDEANGNFFVRKGKPLGVEVR